MLLKLDYLESHKRNMGIILTISGFPDSSVGKESACNAGDPGLICGSGGSAGEGIGYPLQYSWTCLIAQLINNLPAMWENWVWFLGCEKSPGEGNSYPLQYSGLENSMDYTVYRVTNSRTQQVTVTWTISMNAIKNTLYIWQSIKIY